MTEKELEHEMAEMRREIALLRKANLDLVNRNLQLAQQVDAYYDVRRRIQMLKELMIRHRELIRNADLRDDDELMAVIETRLETELQHENPDFGLKELAALVGTSQSRIVELFRRSNQYKSAEDYLDFLRLLRSMYYLQTERLWSVAACASAAGFRSIRSFNRKFQDAIGMTPHEFRDLVNS